jgi:hypothetical protein
MAGLLYYFPGKTRPEVLPDKLRGALGLAHAFPEGATPRECTRGPDGGQGIVVADGRHVSEQQLGHYPELQRWAALPAHPARAWLGVVLADPPRPADLARAQQLPGHLVELADGQRWLCPVARKSILPQAIGPDDQLHYANAVPHVSGLDASGAWTATGVVPRYAQLWPLAEAWFDVWLAAEVDEQATATFDFAGLHDAAVACLAANYRVSKAEIAVLGLLTEAHAVEVLHALIDWPTIEAFLKKKASLPAGCNCAAGPPGAT